MSELLSPSLTSTDTKHLDSVRLLTRLLVVSGCGNFVAILVGLYGCFVGNFWLPPHHLHRLAQEHHAFPSLSNTFHHFHVLSLRQLVECLAETGCVEEGYPIRDLALSYLVWHHHFDALRAMQPLPPVPSTTLSLSIEGNVCTLPFYLGLTSEHYDAMLAFGRREQWPITPEACFALLKNPHTADNASLRDSFCFCTPFQVLYKSLGGKSQEPVEAKLEEGWSLAFCLDRVLEGDWEQFMKSVRAVSQHATSMHLARQTFLAFYPPEKDLKKDLSLLATTKAALGEGVSPVHHGANAVNAVNIVNIVQPPLQVVSRQQPASVGNVTHVTTVALVPRQESSKVGVTVTSVAKPVKRSSNMTPTAAHSIPKLYVVRTGDSLWKIAKTFQVDVDKIKAHNALKSDNLRPGLSLLIP